MFVVGVWNFVAYHCAAAIGSIDCVVNTLAEIVQLDSDSVSSINCVVDTLPGIVQLGG